MQADLICANCKYFNHDKFKCKAFPGGIPDIISSGENIHEKPLKDQINDIVFEPIDEKK